jgi:hypothetical protein
MAALSESLPLLLRVDMTVPGKIVRLVPVRVHVVPEMDALTVNCPEIEQDTGYPLWIEQVTGYSVTGSTDKVTGKLGGVIVSIARLDELPE